MQSRNNQRQTQPGRGKSADRASYPKRDNSSKSSSYRGKSDKFDSSSPSPRGERTFDRSDDGGFVKKRNFGDKPERNPRGKNDSFAAKRFDKKDREGNFERGTRGGGFNKFNKESNFSKNRNEDEKPFAKFDKKHSYDEKPARDFSQRRPYDEKNFRNPRRNEADFVETRFDNKEPKMRSRKPAESKEYNPNDKYSQKKQLAHKKKNTDPTAPMRLNRFLANAGICSRREADELIAAGVVTVNGEVVTEMGARVIPATDRVLFHDQLVRSEKKVYLLLNKPKDCITTSDDPSARLTVLDLVKNACPERIYPVGRLDRNTTGVLLLTNDGDMAAKLTHPKYNKKKIYHVFLNKAVTKADMEQIATGIKLEDGEIYADSIAYIDEDDKKQVGIEIHSGRNRIVRRIFEHLGYTVVRLDRVYFAGLTKKKLARGKWRFLTEKEISMLRMGAYE